MKQPPESLLPVKRPRPAGEGIRRRRQASASAPQPESARLIHELEVHQIQLEMQNAELAQTRARLEDALDRFSSLYDFAPVGYVTLQPDGSIVEANLTAAVSFGMDRLRLIGRRFGLFLDPGSRPAFAAFLAEACVNESGATCDVTLAVNGREPTVARLQGVPAPTLPGQNPSCRVAIEDITAQVKAAEALRSNQQRLELIARASNTGLWDWDLRTNTVYYSPEWKSQLGYAGDEISDSFDEWQSRVHPEDLQGTLARVRNYVEHPLGEFESEFRMRHKNGSYRWILTRAAALQDANGQYSRMLGSHLDITERKRAEEDLRALTVRLRSVHEDERSRIAREIHDELGQMLTGLKMELAGLARRLRRDQQPLLKRCEEAGRFIDSCIANVRRIATELRPGLLDSLGLEAAIEWQVQEFQAHTGIRCSLTLPREQLSLSKDQSTALFRILQESLTNIGRHSLARHASVCLSSSADRLYLVISDDGKGAEREKLTATRSLGVLGMRERAMALGGVLHISALPGNGTTVTASLPAVAPDSAGELP